MGVSHTIAGCIISYNIVYIGYSCECMYVCVHPHMHVDDCLCAWNSISVCECLQSECGCACVSVALNRTCVFATCGFTLSVG